MESTQSGRGRRRSVGSRAATILVTNIALVGTACSRSEPPQSETPPAAQPDTTGAVASAERVEPDAAGAANNAEPSTEGAAEPSTEGAAEPSAEGAAEPSAEGAAAEAVPAVRAAADDGVAEGDAGKGAGDQKTDAAAAVPPAGPAAGRELYVRHCAGCHAENGDGKGLAAPYLFPKPRNFRAGKFRLVSTANGVPTPVDLDAVLVRGMPGSAMPPWAHLSEQDRRLLVAEVLRLRREGAQEQYIRLLKEDEELDDDEIAQEDVQREIQAYVDGATVPGATTEVPEVTPADASAVARGKEVYLKQGCQGCHGNEGKGDGAKAQTDDEGYPTSPRDYTRGIFKGGHDPASLFRRIAYGMPGTPMPASSNLTPAQNMDLVHFIRSLSDEATRQAAVLRRGKLVARHVDHIPEAVDADEWKGVTALGLPMVPLWWRNGADVHLEVQAVHDGKTIALRVSWADPTADAHATQSETFEDAVAMELYRGAAEPFLGMGDPQAPVDVWFWDADRQAPVTSVDQTYPNTVVDVYPFSETVAVSAELDRAGARTADQPDISLPARASGNAIVPSGKVSGASTLAAAGPGTVTFRLPTNQWVEARGTWHDGRWSVIMTRLLAVPAESGGLALEPGGHASVAFAVWDGALRDRDGKKLVTIWQDFLVEDE